MPYLGDNHWDILLFLGISYPERKKTTATLSVSLKCFQTLLHLRKSSLYCLTFSAFLVLILLKELDCIRNVK